MNGYPQLDRGNTSKGDELDVRELYEIYEELGLALLHAGKELSAEGKASQADSRYEEAAQAFLRARHEGGISHSLRLGLARAREAQRRFKDALQAYLEVVRADPGSAVEVLPKAQHCLELEPMLSRAIGSWVDSEWAPDVRRTQLDAEADAAVELFLGSVSLYRADYSAAVKRYQAALELKPDDPFVLEGLGEALQHAGQSAAAVPILENAVCRSDALRLRDCSVTTRLKLGSCYLEIGRHAAAIAVLRQGLALSGGEHSGLWTALARARLGLGRFGGAMQAAQNAIEQNPGLAAAHAILASARLEQGQYRDAVVAAEAALAQDPKDSLAIRVEGQALITGVIDIDQGIRLIRQYLEQSPADSQQRLALARTLRSAGREPNEVIDVLENGTEVEGAEKPPRLYLDLAEAHLDAGNPVRALALLDTPAAKGNGEDLSYWWRIRGDVFRAQNRMAEALDAYEQAIRLVPSDLAALERCATLLDTERRFEEAARVWRQAAEARPYDGRLKLSLALAARNQGATQHALSAVREAIEFGVYGDDRIKAFTLLVELGNALHAPRNELMEAYYELGLEFYWKDDLERASLWFGRATDLDPLYRSARWYQLHLLFRQALLGEFPYWSEAPLAHARRRWQEILDSGCPGESEAWSYVTGALIAYGESQLRSAAQRPALVWEAITYLERSLVLDQSNVYSWINLSRLHREAGNDVNASVASKHALQIDPNNLDAIDERITTLANIGEATGARELIDKRLGADGTAWAEGVNAFVLYLEGNLHGAVEQIGRAIDRDPASLWNLSFRGDCLRLLALSEKGRGDYYERAREDYRKVLARRGDSAYLAYEGSFAWAAYQLGRVKLATEIFESLLGDPLDPNCDCDRIIGCCYLRNGNLDKAEKCLNSGIVRANISTPLKLLDSLLFAEIERDSERWENREPVLALLKRARARIDSALRRVETPSSPEAELRRFIDWEQARVQIREWASIGASAGLARIALATDKLEPAEDLYRILQKDMQRFPEADLGLAKVGLRYRQLGEDKLRTAWEEPDARVQAVRLLERALALDQTASASDRGELLVRLALAQFQIGSTQQATSTFVDAVKVFESIEKDDLGVMLGDVCRELLEDVHGFWALDAYLRELARERTTPEPLHSALPLTIERLGDYLGTAVERADEDDEFQELVFRPIILEISHNLAPEKGKENEWPLLERFIPEMRERIEDEFGVVVPGVRVRDNKKDLPDYSYLIKLDEITIAGGRIISDAKYSPSAPSVLQAAGVPLSELKEAIHPLSKQLGCWVPQNHWDRVQQTEGCSLWRDPMQFAVAHLEAVLRSNLANFLGIQEVWDLLVRWGQTDAKRELIETALPDALTGQRFVRVLRALVREQVPITAWESILTTVRDVGALSDEPSDVVQRVRLTIKGDLPGNRHGASLFAVPPEIEQAIRLWTRTADDRRFFAIPQKEAQELLGKIRGLVQQDDPAAVLVVEDVEVRDPLRRLVQVQFPNIRVQFRGETLDKEERESPLAWAPRIAEWGELWPQKMETSNAS